VFQDLIFLANYSLILHTAPTTGTNNARVTGLLRQLAEFYAKEANHLFIVRIAQVRLLLLFYCQKCGLVVVKFPWLRCFGYKPCDHSCNHFSYNSLYFFSLL